MTATLISTPHCKLIDPCAKSPALNSRAKSSAGIVAVRPQCGPAHLGGALYDPSSALRVLHRTKTPSYDATAISTASLPPKEPLRLARSQGYYASTGNQAAKYDGNAAIRQNSLRCQFRRKYDANNVRNT